MCDKNFFIYSLEQCNVGTLLSEMSQRLNSAKLRPRCFNFYRKKRKKNNTKTKGTSDCLRKHCHKKYQQTQFSCWSVLCNKDLFPPSLAAGYKLHIFCSFTNVNTSVNQTLAAICLLTNHQNAKLKSDS